MDKISIYDYLDYISERWPLEKVVKLKKKLFSKGLIEECSCRICTSQDTTGSGFN